MAAWIMLLVMKMERMKQSESLLPLKLPLTDYYILYYKERKKSYPEES